MNAISKWTMVMALLAGTAYGQQPPDVVKSDLYYNTAMGTDALFHNGTPTWHPGIGLQHRCRGWGRYILIRLVITTPRLELGLYISNTTGFSRPQLEPVRCTAAQLVSKTRRLASGRFTPTRLGTRKPLLDTLRSMPTQPEPRTLPSAVVRF